MSRKIKSVIIQWESGRFQTFLTQHEYGEIKSVDIEYDSTPCEKCKDGIMFDLTKPSLFCSCPAGVALQKESKLDEQKQEHDCNNCRNISSSLGCRIDDPCNRHNGYKHFNAKPVESKPASGWVPFTGSYLDYRDALEHNSSPIRWNNGIL